MIKVCSSASVHHLRHSRAKQIRKLVQRVPQRLQVLARICVRRLGSQLPAPVGLTAQSRYVGKRFIHDASLGRRATRERGSDTNRVARTAQGPAADEFSRLLQEMNFGMARTDATLIALEKLAR